MKILITGGRDYTNINKIREVLSEYKDEKVTFIHGAARGADTLGGMVAKEFGFEIKIFPAEWNKYGRAAGHKRNIQMLDEKPDIVLAFHDDFSSSKGTKHCVECAMKIGIPIRIFGDHKDEE
jgi:adenine/guanine phosphoribosyltransferase-like PRPP-binding protein